MSAAAYADTSLLASLYLADANTPRALAAVAAAARPVWLTTWQEFELENALQLRLFRRESTRADLAAAAGQLAGDLAAGAIVTVRADYAAVLTTARQLTARHAAVHGCRAFDVFHVAAAVHLAARWFLSFDKRQLALARAAGLHLL